MSDADRSRWDERYRQGAYASRQHPSAFLADCIEQLPHRGRALDLACGTGRNAIFLARRGLTVDAVDISSAALERGRAAAGDLPIRWLECDLDGGFHSDLRYDAIVNIRYVDMPLLRSLLPILAPGGTLVVEQHLVHETPVDVVGPKNPAFRVVPGTLAQLAQALAVERLEEGMATDPDGATVALARLLARKPPRTANSAKPTQCHL